MSEPKLKNGFVRIVNPLYEALYKTDFSGSELRIILFIIRQTYGYGMTSRQLTASYVSKYTNIPLNTVNKIMLKLKKRDIVWSKVGDDGKIEIGINKHCQKWQVLAENGNTHLPKTATECSQIRQENIAENGNHIKKERKKTIFKCTESDKPSPLMGEASASEWLSADARERLKAANVLSYPEQPTEHALKIMQIHGYNYEEYLMWRNQ